MTWLTLAVVSTIYVAWDQFRETPEPLVMIEGRLMTLYLGPISLYVLILKQAVGTTIYLLAGDATGIILAAVGTVSFGLTIWLDRAI